MRTGANGSYPVDVPTENPCTNPTYPDANPDAFAAKSMRNCGWLYHEAAATSRYMKSSRRLGVSLTSYDLEEVVGRRTAQGRFCPE